MKTRGHLVKTCVGKFLRRQGHIHIPRSAARMEASVARCSPSRRTSSKPLNRNVAWSSAWWSVLKGALNAWFMKTE